jgi:hypothetical protein
MATQAASLASVAAPIVIAPAPVPETKRTRERDDISKAGTLARKLKKNSEKMAALLASHEEKIDALQAERKELIADVSEAVLIKAQQLIDA